MLDGVASVVTTRDELLQGDTETGMLDVIPVVGDDVDGVSGGPAYTQPHT